MNHSRITWFFVSFVFMVTSTTNSSSNSSKYDITNDLKDSIVRTFETQHFHLHAAAAELRNSVMNPLDEIYLAENPDKCNQTADLISFSILNFYIPNQPEFCTLVWDCSRNETDILFDEFIILIMGMVEMRLDNVTHSSMFRSVLHFQNVSISAAKLPTKEDKIDIRFSYGSYDTFGDTLIRDHAQIKHKERLEMAFIIDKIFPSMIRDRIIRSEKFTRFLNESFFIQPDQEIISKYPDMSVNEHRYYYLVPDIALDLISFTDIKIKGLSKYDKLEMNERKTNYTSTLSMKNISGCMDLRYADEKIKPKQQIAAINFTINRLYVIFDPQEHIMVKIRSYFVDEFPSNFSIPITNWLLEYKWPIMEHMEWAIARSIMPFMKVKGINDMIFRMKTYQMQNSFVQDGDHIKSVYDACSMTELFENQAQRKK